MEKDTVGRMAMDNGIKFDYYYGKEADQFSFYRIPRLLIKDERFKGLSNDAKLLYGLMLDRLAMSIKNGWFDENNRAYIHYTMENVMEDLCCAKEKCSKIFKELDSVNGIGLIEKKRQGLGRPDIIYVKNFVLEDDGEENLAEDSAELQEVRKSNNSEFDADMDRSSEIEPHDIIELPEDRKSNDIGYQVQTSCSSEIELPDGRESNGNYNNNNYTDSNQNNMNHINPINQSSDESCNRNDGYDEMDEVTAYMKIIKENIAYEEHQTYEDKCTMEYFEEIYNIICDIVCVKRKSVRIAGEDYPYELVKSRFLKLKDYHVKYVIDSISGMTDKITNMRAYIITSLYNAPTTANMYLKNEVQHDLYGGGWNE